MSSSLNEITAARQAVREMMRKAPTYTPERPITMIETKTEGTSRPVLVRVYAPAGDTDGEKRPGILYIHGGAFTSGSIDLFDADCLRLADQVDAVVVSVEYRLAPENPYPAGLDDCFDALTWLAETGPSTFGIDPERIAVAGESSGGGLAAGLALLARDKGGPKLCLQALSVPQLDDRLSTESIETFRTGPNFNGVSAENSWNHYLGTHRDDSTPIYAAPARATDLTGLPPAVIAVRQLDPLRDEGMQYAQRLIAAGISTELRHYPDVHHGSHLMASQISERMSAEHEAAMRHRLNKN